MPDSVRYATVEFSPTMVRLAGRLIDAIIPRERIRNIRIVHDTSARYPFLQFFVGFMLFLAGGIGVFVLIFIGPRGALPLRVEDGALHFELVPEAFWLAIALGLWSLLGVFRASYHLTIETDERVRRVLLGFSRDLEDIRQLARGAAWSLGYEIDASVLGERYDPARSRESPAPGRGQASPSGPKR